MRRRTIVTCLLAAALARGQGSRSDSATEHWVTTWATAQQLVAGGRPTGPPANLPATFADQTIRMIVRASLGGRRVRVELSNMVNAQPLEIGGAHVAVHKGGGAIVEGTDRALTYGGRATFTIPAGTLVVSDPVDLNVAPLSDLAVSIYLPHDTGVPASHMLGLHTGYISKGDAVSAAGLPEPSTMVAYVWLAGVEVAASTDAFTVVALGDSITDGYATTRDADRAWPICVPSMFDSSKVQVLFTT